MTQLPQVMTPGATILRTHETVRHAAEMMADLDIGELPVCDGRRLVGVITDRDITVRCTARGVSPDNARVGDAMTERVLWCYQDDSVENAKAKMADEQVRRLMVLDRDKQLVGVVSLGDLAVKAGDAGSTLASVSSPAQPAR